MAAKLATKQQNGSAKAARRSPGKRGQPAPKFRKEKAPPGGSAASGPKTATVRHSEAEITAILDTVADGIITIDQTGTILTFNPAAERIFDYTQAEAVGGNVSMLTFSPFRDEHDGYLKRYLKTGEARIIGRARELIGRRKDGTTFPLELAVSEFSDGMGRRFAGMVRDITERKHLEKSVADRMSEEQQEFSRELHDGVAQHLAAVGMSAALLHRRLREAGSPHAAEAARLGDLISGAQEKVRALIKGMRPIDVIASGLSDALGELAASMLDRYGIACTFESRDAVTVSNNKIATQLYFITAEAVHNVIKHARAERIVVSLEADRRQVILRVKDDGAGIRPNAHQGGVGLHIMSYRAGLIDGVIEVRPGEGGGTVVTCAVPRPAEVQAGSG